MSHTNVDSKKTYHIVNSTMMQMDLKEKRIETPEGGIDKKGKNVKSDFIEINVHDAILRDDNGKILFQGSLEEVEAKKAQIEAERNNKEMGRD